MDVPERRRWPFPWNPDPRVLGSRRYVGHFVYHISDAVTGELLYIGTTGNLRRRSSEHHCSGRYPRTEVTWQIEGPMSKIDALDTEAIRVAQRRPRDNDRLSMKVVE